MNRLGWFLFGAIAVCAAALILLITRTNGFSAREQPGAIETWMARRIRTMAVPGEARNQTNPIVNSAAVQAEARAHWADHCAVCHANDGSGQTPMGSHSYPPAPDMRLADTQHMSDGELYYIIQNGIRFSGMPAWGSGSPHDDHDVDASWKLVHFIRHLPELTLEEKHEMEKLNPKSPDDLKEEQEEEQFLKGETPSEPATQHHHH